MNAGCDVSAALDSAFLSLLTSARKERKEKPSVGQTCFRLMYITIQCHLLLF